MDYYERAKELHEEMRLHRRYIHQNAEVGMNLPKTAEYVTTKLVEMGYDPVRMCESGVMATIGKESGKVLLLRADMDALPMAEESGLDFASQNGCAHTCGHDFHAAMLLGAAKMLKEHEEELEGMVKLVFQPAEETFEGSRALIENGVLENPKVDAALAYHVGPGNAPVGYYMYNNSGTMMFSNDGFKITVKGKGAHGSYPQLSIDPINIAVHIYLALQELIAREVPASSQCVLTIGSLHAGTANNIIPETAELQGSIRSDSKESREHLVSRMKEVAVKVADTYRGSAEVTMLSEVPPLTCNPDFTNEIIKYMSELPIEGMVGIPNIQASASDDFALVLDKVPGCYMFLSAGFTDRQVASSHNPKVIFNENVLPVGAACLAHCATQWLKNHQ